MDSFSTTSQEDSEMESDDSGGRLRNLTDLPPFMSDIIEVSLISYLDILILFIYLKRKEFKRI